MSDSIHAHELLNLIGEQSEPLTLEQLQQLTVANFGEAVKFHTCRLEDQNIDQILKFFIKMEKVASQGDGYVLNRGNMCSH
ncbi:YecH family metal-binding protein [Ferrimonas aestuarii]|uniref:DUF2492 family protein n=1 Tax=Ferrimonas aestuarii TaxID=2569539 RepID=A0A4U1BMZ6_9GAMM|nr:YecH family metal-binding protein [Ferrimonas aestuarii]TKB54751.1 DUF2492 family protein [Ferrimonas aestuarii]